MSGLNPLRIALSGFGGAVLSIALSGFVVETEVVAHQPPVVSESGGGARMKAAQRARARVEHERQLIEEDEALILALVAFVTGETG